MKNCSQENKWFEEVLQSQ